MPKLIYALICSDLIIDKDSSSTSFIRTIEHAVVPDLPATLPPVFFASLWDLENNAEDPFSVSLAMTTPTGETLTIGAQEIKPAGTVLHKMNFQVPGLRVEDEGKHILSVSLKKGDSWETKAELPLFVFKNVTQ